MPSPILLSAASQRVSQLVQRGIPAFVNTTSEREYSIKLTLPDHGSLVIYRTKADVISLGFHEIRPAEYADNVRMALGLTTIDEPPPAPALKPVRNPAPTANEDKGLWAYTDGSYEGEVCSWAVAIFRDGTEVYRASNCIGPNASHQIAGETLAVTDALAWARKHARPGETLNIGFDFLGIQNWTPQHDSSCRKPWQADAPAAIAYLGQYAAATCAGLKIAFHKITAHTGHPRNELVDQLAGEASRSHLAKQPKPATSNV